MHCVGNKISDLLLPSHSQLSSITGLCFVVGTELYCLVTEALVYRCKQLAQGCYLIADWQGLGVMGCLHDRAGSRRPIGTPPLAQM